MDVSAIKGKEKDTSAEESKEKETKRVDDLPFMVNELFTVIQ